MKSRSRKKIPAAVGPLLDLARTPIKASQATTAVFYSISNTQKGLGGVSFGNFLIKQVVEDLKRELPDLKTFVTLSPVPGFASWLAREMEAEASGALDAAAKEELRLLDKPNWHRDPETAERVRAALVPAAAYYFLKAKTPKGRPVDPVARFHLGNGARLERLNFLGDVSVNGLKQSHGLMVNYLYALNEIEKNHEAFAEKGTVAASRAVRKALPADLPSRDLVRPIPSTNSPVFRSDGATMNANLFNRLARNVADPNKTAIETVSGERITYSDLIAWSGRLANALTGLGVKPGDRVAAQVEKSVAAIVLYLATVRAGGVFLPLNTAYTPAEVEYFLGDAEPALFVCDPGKRAALEPIANKVGAKVLTLDAQGKEPSATPRRARRMSSTRLSARPMTSPRSYTPPARRGVRREPCSRTRTSPPTRKPCGRRGVTLPMTC